jgi:hypothetical protein
VAHREFGGNQFDVQFSGKVEKDEIKGTIKVDFGNNGPQEFEWIAKRAIEPDDVLGVWKLVVESSMGPMERQFTITKDHDKLQGLYHSQFADHDAKDLTLKDNQLSWEVSGEREGRPFKIVYDGRPRGNAIEGTCDFDFGGDIKGTTKFTGKRTPPEKEKPAADAKPSDAPK